jgi:hypothetical protein
MKKVWDFRFDKLSSGNPADKITNEILTVSGPVLYKVPVPSSNDEGLQMGGNAKLLSDSSPPSSWAIGDKDFRFELSLAQSLGDLQTFSVACEEFDNQGTYRGYQLYINYGNPNGDGDLYSKLVLVADDDTQKICQWWHHNLRDGLGHEIEIIGDRAAGTCEMLIDGVSKGVEDISSLFDKSIPGYPLCIGAQKNGAYGFNGILVRMTKLTH